MYLKVPAKYKDVCVSIQKIQIDPYDPEEGYTYELNLYDGYGVNGDEEDSGMIYYESYRDLMDDLKRVKPIKY